MFGKVYDKLVEGWRHQELDREQSLGDFTTTYRVIPISALAVVIGIAGAYITWLLLQLIGLFTNVFYYGQWSTAMVSPAENHLGAWAGTDPRCRIDGDRVDGALRLGSNSRAWNSGSD